MKFYAIASGLLLSILFTAGCKVGPDYVAPETVMPNEWNNAPVGPSEDPNMLRQWWTVFDDPVLTQLIEQADRANVDLAAAFARILQSRALRNAAAGQYAPGIDATGYYSRTRQSENGFAGGFGPISTKPFDLYSVGFDAAWEIDLFGRIGRSVEAAHAAWEASIEDFYSVQTSLFAEVARNYIELRAAQERIRLAQSNIEIQQKTLELTQGRFEAELSPKLDVSQAQLNLANTESEIPLLRITEAAALNRLIVLTQMPQELQAQLAQAGEMPIAPADIEAGIPAEIIRRRPDVRQAERTLAAQTAQIGVATSNLYPALSLTGTFSLQATDFSDLGDWSSRSYSFGPGFRWNLFNGNQFRSLVQVEEARALQFLAGYESAVLQAVEEVENAMIGFVQQKERVTALERSVAAAQESVQLSETLYRSGLADFENVLVNQRALSMQQDRLAVSQSQVLAQAIALYKALGGGWDYEASLQARQSTESLSVQRLNEQ